MTELSLKLLDFGYVLLYIYNITSLPVCVPLPRGI